MSRDYRLAHAAALTDGNGYDSRFAEPGNYEYEIWQAERALLGAVIERYIPEPRRLLDFACGTGRILAELEGRFEESVGVDISPRMLARAREKLHCARLVCGDPTQTPSLIVEDFDLITAFRFFLNAQPVLRDQAMAWLASRLRDERSVLFFNVHGNYFSTRQLSARVKWLQGKDVSWMTRGQVHRLVARHGLQVVEEFGRGFVDKFIYKHVPRTLWRGLEGGLRRLLPERFAVNLYFVCRRAP